MLMSLLSQHFETLTYLHFSFGHQEGITGIDSLARERAVTSGGRDNSVRIWKIVEESQLVFNGQGWVFSNYLHGTRCVTRNKNKNMETDYFGDFISELL